MTKEEYSELRKTYVEGARDQQQQEVRRCVA
jgi:hypothetical protein